MKGRNLFLFALMSLIWGTTWIAAKAGVSEVPPVFFAAARFALVACLFIPAMRSVGAAFARPLMGGVVLTGILLNVVTYGFLFWGMKFVPSGIAGATNLSVVAIGSFGFAVAFGQQRPDRRYMLALVAGVAGLFVLFSRELTVTGRMSELIGAGAIIVGTLSYCLGSVLAKPLLNDLEPRQLTAAHAIVGAIGLTCLSLAIEPVSLETARKLLQPGVARGLAVPGRIRNIYCLHDLSPLGPRLGITARRPLCVHVSDLRHGAGSRRLCRASRHHGNEWRTAHAGRGWPCLQTSNHSPSTGASRRDRRHGAIS